MRKFILLSAIMCALNVQALVAQNCAPPTNLIATDITSCEVTLHWQPSGTVLKYNVRYKLSTTTQWSKQINAHTDTFYRITGLQSGVKYNFQVTAHCSAGNNSTKVKTDATTAECSMPQSVSITATSSTTANISVSSSCFYDSLHVQYRTLNGSPQIISFPSSATPDHYIVSGLNEDSVYLFQVSTCPLHLNNWTTADTVHLIVQPNILIIMVDDARNDYYSCNGAPPFFHTPNIDRIANEGVNFKNTFVVASLCEPSRASIATGLFTTKTGVTKNGIPLDTTFNTIPKFLKSHGYYTALVGKNHGIYLNGSVPEFNYYMAFDDYARNNGMKFDYNGDEITISKHQTLTLTDTTIALIERIPQPFFIYTSYVDPHLPPNPLPSFVGRYDNEVIPWKADTARYTENYPSFLYNQQNGLIHGIALDTTYRHILEAVAGVDSCTGEILRALENSGRLDNTLIIFLSDNGHTMGAHYLSGKTSAYEPSMRIPLFMRYPKWFTPGSKVVNSMALNLDLAPTIYQAAGLTYTDSLDGFSLKDMYDGLTTRTEFYYAMLHDSAADPAKKAIRDFSFKYMRYLCKTDTVEELFDMVNDTLELTNLINDSRFTSTLATYRLKFDSIQNVWDHTPAVLKKCSLENPIVTRQMAEEVEEYPDQPVIYPALTSGGLEIYNPWPEAILQVYDGYGRTLNEYRLPDLYSDLSLSDLPNGIYFIRMSYEEKSLTQKIMLQR